MPTLNGSFSLVRCGLGRNYQIAISQEKKQSVSLTEKQAAIRLTDWQTDQLSDRTVYHP